MLIHFLNIAKLLTRSSITFPIVDSMPVCMATRLRNSKKCPYARPDGENIVFGDTDHKGMKVTMRNTGFLALKMFFATQFAMFIPITWKRLSFSAVRNAVDGHFEIWNDSGRARFPAERMQLLRLSLAIASAQFLPIPENTGAAATVTA